ncbi:hypothetical protein [Enterovirga rhinocerotis]|uniref:Uncharacterized protein n=1 Tax=Enterovirga rhinocerotis TaxID=1339210 RepID=A0A4R7C4Z6_9HYPH|nr:hypothetical protein [Enterovirga rhinocerotis]TDR93103.1 hypothetical protein EV668_0357 [Enterovirga rhinocerotis]
MKNDTIKSLLQRIEDGTLLNKDEQVEVLKDLLRANRRVQAAKRAGYIESPRRPHGASSPLTH